MNTFIKLIAFVLMAGFMLAGTYSVVVWLQSPLGILAAFPLTAISMAVFGGASDYLTDRTDHDRQ